MPLEIENRGKGFIGEIGAGWSISQNGSPMIVGDQPGRLGGLNFSARCDSTSKFTIDNYLSVRHYSDNQTDRWLSTFDGYLRSVETNGEFGQFSMSSILPALDVERTSSVDVAGTFQRTIDLPVGAEYTIGVTTYTIGGYWTSVGSENVFVPRPTIIWDIAANEHYIYVLVAGQHSGEVVVEIGVDGVFRSLWPVYSDATDLADPGSRYITVEEGRIWIGQVNADRVKRFDLDGTFVLQWGSAGSGDGQFNTIAGIASSESFGAVYVSDSVLGRIQYFNDDGTYLGKWGTSGTGTGDTVFNSPNGLSVDPVNGQVLVSDRNARVRAYSFTGTYIAQVAGSYDFTTATSTGEFVAGGYPIRTGFDHLHNVYAMQLGKVFKYVKVDGGWELSSGEPIRQWDSKGIDDPSTPPAMSVNHFSGILYVPRAVDKIDQYAASLGNLKAYLLYYIALATPDFPVRLLDLNDDYESGELAYIAWRGNVWQQLCDLCAATKNAMVVFDDRLCFMNRVNRSLTLPKDAVVTPVRFESRAAGRAIQIVNQNSRYTDGQEVLYSSQADNGRTFNVDVNTFAYVNVSQNTYPEFVNDPQPDTDIGDGKYVVVDANLLVVDPVTWTNYGASVRADIGDTPGTILLTITGPGLEIPGYESPYKISTVGKQASLSVTGAGVVGNPETFTIGTGVPEEITNRAIGHTVNSPFIRNAELAYSEGSWTAYNSGTPNQRFTISYRTSRANRWVDDISGLGGLFQVIGAVVHHDDAQYVVETLDYTATTITLGVYRYTKLGWETVEAGTGVTARPEEIWSGKTAGEFDAYWIGYTAQDFTIAPLRNPYGV